MPERDPPEWSVNQTPPDGYSAPPPHPNGAVTPTGSTRRRRRRRRLLLIGGGLFLAVWIFAIVWSVTITTRSPEKLDAPAGARVEAACRAAQTSLKALPAVKETDGGAVRVARVRTENSILTTMTERFDEVTPAHGTPTHALRAWTGDWRRIIEARARYATDLETKHRARLELPATGGIKPISDNMDDFVREQHHQIDTCFTDSLQAEVVEGPRVYKHVED